jgi:hypothetical protein
MFGLSNQPVDPQTHIALEHAQAQRNFALLVFIFSFFLLLIVSLNALSGGKLDPETVFTTITTLVGTWVGTLLAFFYSRENFESASRSLQQTIQRLTPDEKLGGAKVADMMIPRGEMTSFDLKVGQDFKTIPLAELEALLVKAKVSRLPILNADGSAAAIVHGSLIAQFRSPPDAATPPAPDPSATLGDLMKRDDFGEKVTRLGFVGRDRSLRDAKAAMNAQPKCKDVFVTATGGANEPVVGWVTDTSILLALDA